MKKIQAEAGDAPERDGEGKLVKDAEGKLKLKNTGTPLRWVGNGRTIYNNKGNAVKQYEPYFDSTPEYNNENELVELGCTSVIFYDALGRVIRTEHPNGTFSKVEFDAWMQKTWDQNDTVLNDKCEWFKARINGQKGEAEQQAAQKTTLYHETPALIYLDSLARPFLSVVQNKTQRSGETLQEEFYYTRTYLDIEGNALKITNVKDTAEQEVMTWKYDMLGNICFQHSTDAGDRWILRDVMGKTLRIWDSRSQTFLYNYDELHRPLALSVINGATEIQFEKYEYGEALADVAAAKNKNVRGKLFRHFDTAGVAVNDAFDFKGNLLQSGRQLLTNYKVTPDWKNYQVLEDQIFAGATKYDALNRPTEL